MAKKKTITEEFTPVLKDEEELAAQNAVKVPDEAVEEEVEEDVEDTEDEDSEEEQE